MAESYIRFEEAVTGTKTKGWEVLNKRSNDSLGTVRWYAPWRQYCFFPASVCVFSVGCMEDLIQFIALHKNDRNAVTESSGHGGR